MKAYFIQYFCCVKSQLKLVRYLVTDNTNIRNVVIGFSSYKLLRKYVDKNDKFYKLIYKKQIIRNHINIFFLLGFLLYQKLVIYLKTRMILLL